MASHACERKTLVEGNDRFSQHEDVWEGLNLARCAVFCDFDNTVTPFDVVDDLLERFSITREWVELEEAWQAGRISSKACLEGQLRSVRITPEALATYLATVPMDPSFRNLIALLERHGTQPVIVSDSFSLFIEAILKQHGIPGLTVYSNEIRFAGERLLPSFPYVNGCPRCAHCKKAHLLQSRKEGKIVLYIGDGLSDVCPAEHADVVFAKGNLLAYCQKTQIPYVAFRDLGDVHHYLKRHAQSVRR